MSLHLVKLALEDPPQRPDLAGALATLLLVGMVIFSVARRGAPVAPHDLLTLLVAVATLARAWNQALTLWRARYPHHENAKQIVVRMMHVEQPPAPPSSLRPS